MVQSSFASLLRRLSMGIDIDNGSRSVTPRTLSRRFGSCEQNKYLVGLILDDTPLAFVIDEGATRPGAAVAAKEASVMSAVAGATCEAASKEKGRRYEEADDSSPREAEGIAAD